MDDDPEGALEEQEEKEAKGNDTMEVRDARATTEECLNSVYKYVMLHKELIDSDCGCLLRFPSRTNNAAAGQASRLTPPLSKLSPLFSFRTDH